MDTSGDPHSLRLRSVKPFVQLLSSRYLSHHNNLLAAVQPLLLIPLPPPPSPCTPHPLPAPVPAPACPSLPRLPAAVHQAPVGLPAGAAQVLLRPPELRDSAHPAAGPTRLYTSRGNGAAKCSRYGLQYSGVRELVPIDVASCTEGEWGCQVHQVQCLQVSTGRAKRTGYSLYWVASVYPWPLHALAPGPPHALTPACLPTLHLQATACPQRWPTRAPTATPSSSTCPTAAQ